MFLNLLNPTEKENFIKLAVAVIKADGVIEESEKQILTTYATEMQIPVCNLNEQYDNCKIIMDFATKSTLQIKRIVFIELMALAFADGNYAVEEKNATCKTYVEEDGITYISGRKNCIDFNYVWYSGKLWRITAIYPDGTMKMITDDVITTIDYGSNVNFYTDTSNSSFMYQWLNEDFLSTLYNYENIIVTDASWNATNSNASSDLEVSTKLPETTMVTAPVGLLNSYEYYKSYQNTSYGNGYLVCAHLLICNQESR